MLFLWQPFIIFDQDDINDIFKFLNLMFYINTIIMFIQFGALGYKQDNLGGIFGVETGCNGYIHLLFLHNTCNQLCSIFSKRDEI